MLYVHRDRGRYQSSCTRVRAEQSCTISPPGVVHRTLSPSDLNAKRHAQIVEDHCVLLELFNSKAGKPLAQLRAASQTRLELDEQRIHSLIVIAADLVPFAGCERAV